ncbi:polysaccharide biosynthesis tyrosine autokinase [Pseudonocardia sp. H11422]|uniref:polysaccharide biosynthesis tyrosine autokinase n=1 Tax=Pseudonocardia sp. H11422 TaxID=2835866 RepID=UPI001BDC1A1A|nr:polysaccharide biosynthesis tyrosine autokinase [Pseudonocardia sp. H11422]
MTPREYAEVFRGRWRVVVAGLVLGIVVAGAVTLLAPRQYSAEAGIFVSANSNSADPGVAFDANQLLAQRMRTYVELVTSKTIAREVVDDLQLPIGPDELAEQITATTAPDTFLITVAVTDRSPEQAARIANVVADELSQRVAQIEQPADPALSPLIDADVFDEAVPPVEPVFPRPVLTLGLGAVVGLLIGLAGALLRNALDQSVRTRRQLAAVLDARVLGATVRDRRVPGHPLVVREDPHAPGAEAFRQMRTNLRFVDVDPRYAVIVVTSAVSGEGKTTVVCNLAVAMADAGSRVLVIEADLRRPKAADVFGLGRETGLSDVLAHGADPARAIQRWEDGLDVLTSGPLPPNPSELLDSTQMATLVDTIRREYDVVLIDAPPLLPVTDAALLACYADGALLAVRHGRITADQARAAGAALGAVSARLLGTVMTIVPSAGVRRYVKRDAAFGSGPRSSTPDANRPAAERAGASLTTPEPVGPAAPARPAPATREGAAQATGNGRPSPVPRTDGREPGANGSHPTRGTVERVAEE